MKGYKNYNPVAGLNPLEEELKGNAATFEFQAKRMAVLGKLMGYFAPFSEINSDDIGSINAYSSSLTFTLAVKESRFVHALAQFTGLKFEKTKSYDGKSITLNAEVPEDHLLGVIGITLLSVAGYLPASCKTVITEYKPLDLKQAEVYRELLEKGQPVYATDCSGEEIPEEIPA